MNKKTFQNPKITINKVYTKTGDRGTTQLVGGKTISKSNIRIKAFGELDELNSLIGLCLEKYIEKHITKVILKYDSSKFSKEDGRKQILNKINDKKKLILGVLEHIQHQIFNAGNMMATLEMKMMETSPQITENDIKFLEDSIDMYNEKLPPLKSFVLPGGNELNAYLHIARSVCRRSERTIVELNEIKQNQYNEIVIKFVNRLSDLLFVLSRWVVLIEKDKEVLWSPNYNEAETGKETND